MRHHHLTQATPILDHHAPAIRQLIQQRNWTSLGLHDRVGAAYAFVRDEIAFGYNTQDDLPASRVLADGIGQCNTKGTLLMALLRAMDVPCRFHGFTIDKAWESPFNQSKFSAAPPIIHSWVEVDMDGRWINLEGFILDRTYLSALQKRFSQHNGPFCGYGAAVDDLQNPPIAWQGESTYIQRNGINHDFGLFDTPDDFYTRHGTNLSGFKRYLFQHVVRHWMNKTVQSIRSGK